ncbi:MAG: DUF29 domain-containing protein [Hyphomonadaceae bacterium]|nr:DUF29 domain-containing protein [Hyphomonadaceae bacterium]
MTKLYEADFYTWALTQADAARRRSANEIDWDNVAEELESLGKSEARELSSRYLVLLTHLLKWIYQPDKRSKSWRATIQLQRKQIGDHLKENPGLKSRERKIFASAYAGARIAASGETEQDEEVFPEAAPFTMKQAKDAAWLP